MGRQVAAANGITAEAPLSVEDFVLQGIKLGDPADWVVQKLGDAKSKIRKQEGLSYEYGGFEVIVNNRG
jgi:hypothetical protein